MERDLQYVLVLGVEGKGIEIQIEIQLAGRSRVQELWVLKFMMAVLK